MKVSRSSLFLSVVSLGFVGATFLSISAGVSSLVDGEAGLASSWLWREMA